jgi:ribosomal protein S27E
MAASPLQHHFMAVRMVHCEHCRFSFESGDPVARCPQCGQAAVEAEDASQVEDDIKKTIPMRIVPTSDE